MKLYGLASKSSAKFPGTTLIPRQKVVLKIHSFASSIIKIKVMKIEYRKALKSDIEAISSLVAAAIAQMERNGIFQWDEFYPAKEDFLSDIENGWLYTGCENGGLCVVYAVNKECDEQYKNGRWKYPAAEFRVIHRLCVHPKHQNRGIARQTLAQVEEIRLDVYSENPFALALYQKNGYEKTGTADWLKGKFFLMEKYLGEAAEK